MSCYLAGTIRAKQEDLEARERRTGGGLGASRASDGRAISEQCPAPAVQQWPYLQSQRCEGAQACDRVQAVGFDALVEQDQPVQYTTHGASTQGPQNDS